MKLTLVQNHMIQVPMGFGKTKDEEVTVFSNEDGTVKVAYRANPNRAWEWVSEKETTPEGAKLFNRVVKAHLAMATKDGAFNASAFEVGAVIEV
jgi:hypothetical protein